MIYVCYMLYAFEQFFLLTLKTCLYFRFSASFDSVLVCCSKELVMSGPGKLSNATNFLIRLTSCVPPLG